LNRTPPRQAGSIGNASACALAVTRASIASGLPRFAELAERAGGLALRAVFDLRFMP
jgi:hypothetical protein